METPKVGDRVRVPWGLDILDGVVLQVDTSDSGGRAVIQVDLPDASEEEGEVTTVALPLSRLQPEDWWPETGDPTGRWAAHASYERQVAEALRRALNAKHLDIELVEAGTTPDRGYDFNLRLPAIDVVIIVKYFHRSRASSRQVSQVAENLRRAEIAVADTSVFFIITNTNWESPIMKYRLRQIADFSAPLHIVTWKSRADDPSLERAIQLYAF